MDNNQYPKWERSWKDNLSEVDDNIKDFFVTARDQTEETFSEISERVKHLFEKKELDPESKAEFTKFKADAKLWNEQVKNRVTHLVQDGKIAWNKMVNKD